jgi:GYD domain.
MAAKPKPGKRAMSAAASAQQYYLIQFSYTSAAWDTLLKAGANERNRVAAVKDLVYKLGGCIATITFECDGDPTPKEKFGAFGDYDVVLLVAFPSDQHAATFALAISAGGAVSSFKTTRILPWPQMMEAMASAASNRVLYKAPGK